MRCNLDIKGAQTDAKTTERIEIIDILAVSGRCHNVRHVDWQVRKILAHIRCIDKIENKENAIKTPIPKIHLLITIRALNIKTPHR